MADEKEYEVVIQHDGDRQYWAGDKRTLLKSDGDRLVKMGVLRETGSAKAEPVPMNKAEPAPDNKAVTTASRSRRRG